MIQRKSKREIALMQEAGKLVASLHKEIAKKIKPGVTTLEIDTFAEEYMIKNGAKPAQKGYQGYPFATCASLNDEICHGFPDNKPLKDGDVVKIDFVVDIDGALADSAWTYLVGHVSDEIKKQCEVTKEALYAGIKAATVNSRVGDIGAAIEEVVNPHGYGIVKDFAGHGIGPTIHEQPNIPHYGEKGKGKRMKEGTVITIEPMINAGKWQSKMDDNGWTARTVDGSISVQYEHTIAITEDGPLILTEQDEV